MSNQTPGSLAFPPLVLGAPERVDTREGPLLSERLTVEGVTADSPVEDIGDGVEALLTPLTETAPNAGATSSAGEPIPVLGENRALKGRRRTVKPEKRGKARKDDMTELESIETKPLDVAGLGAGPQPLRLPFWARIAYPTALIMAALWSAPLVAFCIAYQNHYGPFEYAPFPPVVFGALALLPAAFMILGAYVLRQAAKLSMETLRARTLAEELAIPAALAVDQAGGAAQAVRREVARATEAGEAAERQMLSLRHSLADESERLIAATEMAERTARALSESLSRERTGMAALSSSLALQVEAMTEAIGKQTQLVAETSDLASVQLQEAQAALAARASDLAAAAGEAGEAAELAGEALTRQTERLEAVGELVGDRLQTLNEDLGRGHSRLADLAVRLQADQQALADRLEAQRLSAVATVAETQESVIAVTDGAGQAAATLRDLIAEADARLRSVGEAVQSEQAALDARARASLALFRDAVADERAAIESESLAAITKLAASAQETRRTAAADLEAAESAAAAQAEAARAQVEQLGEAAFAAGQRADKAFDSRIAAARRTIEESAALLEEAGLQSLGRIDSGVGATKAAIGEVGAMLTAVDQRLASMPAEARTHAETVRAAVEASLAQFSASARRVADDTEAVDAALQERVRRNYDMLSEALKTMGKVAAVTEQAAARAAPGPIATPPAQSVTPVALAPTPNATPSPTAPVITDRIIRTSAPQAPAMRAVEPGLRPAALAATEAGLRPRLRLTPEPGVSPPRHSAPIVVERSAPVTHETLDPFIRAGAPSSVRSEPPRDTAAWTWKDLLSSIDEPPIDDEVLAERLISEIEALGLDAATLLPLPQIDDIAAAMQKGDVESVRDAVRALAPSAVRRLSRRVLTDKVLRAQADRYVRRYEDLLSDSARRDRDGFMTAALLGSEPGRAFLLFDAAVGELH